jgi:hypothetical protein
MWRTKMQLQPVKTIFTLTLSAAAVVVLAGCSMPKASDFKPSKLFSLGDEDEPEKGIPVRMVGTWTDTVHTKAGQQAQRGFGGRLVFYGKKEEKPILVDGQLVVYAFDETGRAVTDNKPTRRYVFPPDQLPLHMSVSELGASYSFFLPWDEVGGPQTEVSLICRFEPKGGGVISSEQTRHRLPGTIPTAAVADGKPPQLPEGVPYRPAQPTLESVQASRIQDPNVQQASFESPLPNIVPTAAVNGAAPINGLQMTTTSIPLPQHYHLPIGQPAAASGLAQKTLTSPPAAHAGAPTGAPTSTNSVIAAPPQLLQSQQQQLGTGSQVPPPTALPQQPTQQTRLGFGALPTPQSITPTVLMPTTYSPQVQSHGIVPPYQSQAAATQPVAPPAARMIPARTIAWNTVQQGSIQQPQLPAVSQPHPLMPALQQPTAMQPQMANVQQLPAGMSTAAVGQAF